MLRVGNRTISPLAKNLYKTPIRFNQPTHRQFHATSIKMVRELKSLDEFQTEVAFSGLTVIDFYATWCGPCKMISPVVEKLSEKFTQAHFYKVDVDESPAIAAEYAISAMPTFLIFKGGEKIDTIVGANVAKLQQIVKENA